jgi:hypothetical protein
MYRDVIEPLCLIGVDILGWVAGWAKNRGWVQLSKLNLVLPLIAGARHWGLGITLDASHSATESCAASHLLGKSRPPFDHEFNGSIQLLPKFRLKE